MKADEIEAVVDKLLKLKKNNIDVNSLTEFDDFRLHNKLFYETVMSDSFDTNIYKQMMVMKRRLEGGEDPYSVDVKFGEYMAEKYINPVISRTKKED